SNQFSGVISDLSALTKLTGLNLSTNEFTGTVPDLSALTALTRLDLSDNQLSGPFPDLSLNRDLISLDLSSNLLTGPILDLNHLTKLVWLTLNDNRLAGPIPDLNPLTSLRGIYLTGNSLCLPAGATLSHPNSTVAAQLARLSLPACTSSEHMLAPNVPQNLSATVSGNQVTLTWDPMSDAASFDLRAWNSLDRQWGSISNALTTTTFTYTVQTDGRIYYFQIRARNAGDMRGPWSARAQAIIVPQQFPPPPASLGLDIFYQKYANASGITVVAPSEVSDDKMVLVRDVVTGMLSTRSDLLDILVEYPSRVVIYKRNEDGEGITQLPEFHFLSNNVLGYVHDGADAIIIGVPAVEPYCNTLIHEMAHAVHFAIDEQASAADFNTRLEAAYQAAMNAGRWQGLYASRNYREYWAEAVQIWFQDTMPVSLSASYSTLNDYDPDVATLVEEVFGDASLVAYCKP
ncbi:MAG: fibronectin type III domain-containing protein, partial [Caldilineaceae bacterium]|nr:fibronectin type III domain-containing protein [Caldilineaceae bacterium]